MMVVAGDGGEPRAGRVLYRLEPEQSNYAGRMHALVDMNYTHLDLTGKRCGGGGWVGRATHLSRPASLQMRLVVE